MRFYEQFYGFHALRTVGECTSRHPFRYGGLNGSLVPETPAHFNRLFDMARSVCLKAINAEYCDGEC